MKFGNIDSTRFGFGHSDDDDNPGGWCFVDMRGVLEYKICKATKGTGGGGQVDASEQNVDKIRIRSKPNHATYTCKSSKDHLTSQCVCDWSKSVRNNGGVAMYIGKCDEDGWQEYSFRKKMSMGDLMSNPGGTDWECGIPHDPGKHDKYHPVKPCDGCITKKYDKEFDLSDVFNPWWLKDTDKDGNPVLIQYRHVGPPYDPFPSNPCTHDDWKYGPADRSSWWCTSQAALLFDHAVNECGAMVSLDPSMENAKIATLTPEVQECLLKTLGCDSKDKVVGEALMSKFTSDLASGSGEEPMFPRVDCETGECEGAEIDKSSLLWSPEGCEDDVDKKFRCK